MKPFLSMAAVLGILWPVPAVETPLPGDSIYGRVTAVRRADVVEFQHAAGTYTVRIVGIVVPQETRGADSAAAFLRSLVLNRDVRIRPQGRLRTGELLARVFTTDTLPGIREISVVLVQAGLVRRQENVDFKYGELAAAEAEARRARRGLWR